MSTPRLGALAVALILSATSRPAPADTPEALLTRAVATKERALENDDPKLWLETLQAFQRADAARPSAGAAYEVAFAAERLKQDDLAVEMYEASLQRGVSGRARVRAEEFVAGRAAEMARVEVRGGAGTAVYVRGAWRATLPAPRVMVVTPGDLTLDVLGPNGQRFSRAIHTRPGERIAVDLAPPRPTPTASEAAPSGPRRSAPARSATPGAEPTFPEQERAPGRAPAAPAAAAIGLIVGGLGVTAGAGVLLVIANKTLENERNHLRLLCEVPDGDDVCLHGRDGYVEAAQEDVDTIETFKGVRVGTFVAGGVGLIATASGVALLATRPRRHTHARRRPALLPVATVADTGGFIGVRGNF